MGNTHTHTHKHTHTHTHTYTHTHTHKHTHLHTHTRARTQARARTRTDCSRSTVLILTELNLRFLGSSGWFGGSGGIRKKAQTGGENSGTAALVRFIHSRRLPQRRPGPCEGTAGQVPRDERVCLKLGAFFFKGTLVVQTHERFKRK